MRLEARDRGSTLLLCCGRPVIRVPWVGLWAVSDAICSTNGPEAGCHPQPLQQGERKKKKESCTLARLSRNLTPLLGDSPPSLTEFQVGLKGPAPHESEVEAGR